MVVVPAISVSVTAPVVVIVANVAGELVKIQAPPLFDVGGLNVISFDVVFLSVGTVKATDTTEAKSGKVMSAVKSLLTFDAL